MPDRLGRFEQGDWSVVDIPGMRVSYGWQFAVTDDGVAWLCCKEREWAGRQRLLRFDGREWQVVDDPARGKADAPLPMDAAGATLWVRR